MEFNGNLYNAAVIGENPEAAFIVEGQHLHAVEKHIAEKKKEKSNPKLVLPLMRDALKALVKFAEGKVSTTFTEMISLKPNEQDQIVEKIEHIYKHLPHHDRNELSSLIHHKQALTKR